MGSVKVWSEPSKCDSNILLGDIKITTFTNIVLFSIPDTEQRSETK